MLTSDRCAFLAWRTSGLPPAAGWDGLTIAELGARPASTPDRLTIREKGMATAKRIEELTIEGGLRLAMFTLPCSARLARCFPRMAGLARRPASVEHSTAGAPSGSWCHGGNPVQDIWPALKRHTGVLTAAARDFQLGTISPHISENKELNKWASCMHVTPILCSDSGG